MEISLFIGSLLGPLLVAIGLGMLLNPSFYKKMVVHLANEPIALYVASVAGFCTGLLMVDTHNIWEPSWRVIITLLSWAILIKSALLLVLPGYFDNFIKKIPAWTHIIMPMGGVYILIGCILAYKSFM